MAIVKSLEDKTTSTNKPYKRAGLEDGRWVSIWSDHPLFTAVVIGTEIPDNMLYQKGQYWNLSNPQRSGRKAATTRANNQRAEQIKEAQDRKEESITFFNATNSAIALVAPNSKGYSDGDLKEQIKTWRDWFIKEHEAYKNRGNFDKQFPEEEDPLEDVAREKQEDEIAADDIPW